MEYPIRINKYLAARGVASRREADAMIAAKQILVNGKPAIIGQQITAADVVDISGQTVPKRYLAYYKPRGILTHSPGVGESDIAAEIAATFNLTAIHPIGRLDKDSEGLILLCDDGRVTGPLLDPDAQHEKEYEVVVDKPINNWFQKHMAEGVSIEGYKTKVAEIIPQKSQKRFNLIITEGKKHQIRRMSAALGYQVQSLKRVRIMHIELGDIKPGQYRKLTNLETTQLLSALKITK